MPTQNSPARGADGSKSPNPIDIHVGQRVRQRRTLLGLSQEKLGDALDLTFQQVQKYERGANRIGASRLFDISRILDVPISYFFEDLDESHGATGSIVASAPDGEIAPLADISDPLAKRETLELVRAYYRITDSSIRKRVFELAKSFSDSSD